MVVMAAPSGADREEPGQGAARGPRGRGELILVVDDEPALRRVVERILTEAGYAVLAAGTGEAALKVLENEQVDLMITDVIMPGMLGSELVRKLRARDRETPVIYMSAFTAQAAELAAEAPLLDKPFDPETLLTMVRMTLDRHQRR